MDNKELLRDMIDRMDEEEAARLLALIKETEEPRTHTDEELVEALESEERELTWREEQREAERFGP